jgi:hypothetical protein
VSGTDDTGSYRIIDSDQNVRSLKVQPPLTLSLDPTDNSLTIGGTSQIRTFNGNMTFYAPVDFHETVTVGYTNLLQPIHPACPCPAAAPRATTIPSVNIKNSLQSSQLMIAEDGVMKFYCDKDLAVFTGDLKVGNKITSVSSRVLGDLTVDGDIINTNLQDQISNIQLTPGPTGPQGEQGVQGPAGRHRSARGAGQCKARRERRGLPGQQGSQGKYRSPRGAGEVQVRKGCRASAGPQGLQGDHKGPEAARRDTQGAQGPQGADTGQAAPTADPTFTGTLTAPTINASSALQLNGTSTNTLYASKAWVQCIVNANGAILSGSSVGRVSPTITRTSGQAAGAWDIAFTTHPNSFNYTHSIQVRIDSGLAFGVVSNVSAGSCKVRLYNASQVLTDYQFSLVIFA